MVLRGLYPANERPSAVDETKRALTKPAATQPPSRVRPPGAHVHWQRAWRRLWKRRVVTVGFLVFGTVAAASLLAPWVAWFPPDAMSPIDRIAPPNTLYWMGTDVYGRDIFSRVLWGGRLSYLIGAGAAGTAMLVGTVVGLLAGYHQRLDNLLMRVMDGVMAFPPIVLAITMMAGLGQGATNVVITLAAVYTPRVARLVRSSVLLLREEPFVEAARAIGLPDSSIIFRHILPNCVSPLIVQGTFIFAYSVLGEAALSFLGVGVPPFIPTWGIILSEGRLYATIAPWMTISPGLAIFFTVLGMNLIGDGLRDALDPRLRGL
ncbi:MAG: ABC transporter permease [Nitrospinae bacterium]|nr:ABC transporter permease [Candidatus Rokubacteria bacterium]MBI3328478.1 ABC transporter permease [Nitrospinota bacterium]